jgi:AraC-like DNA-binding protein
MENDSPKKMGRPPKVLDDALFDKIIILPLIRDDIAKIMGCSDEHLNTYCKRRFGKTFLSVQEENRQIFRSNILAKQYEMAMKGNIPLLIFLGKNYCKQSDKHEIQGSESKPLTLQYTPNAIKEAITVSTQDTPQDEVKEITHTEVKQEEISGDRN